MKKSKKKSLKESAFVRVSQEQYELDSSDMIRFAERYAKLGSAVIEQFHDLMNNAADAEINSNAYDLMKSELSGFSQDIDSAFSEYESYLNGDEHLNDEAPIDDEDDGSWEYAARINGMKV